MVRVGAMMVAGAVLAVLAGAVAAERTLEEVGETIRAHVREVQGHAGRGDEAVDECSRHTCCDMETDACGLESMTPDETTLVLPGGETQCIFDDSGPFMFQVIPGDNDKVMLYAQGGGACWDEVSTDLEFCTTSATPSSLQGIFDREDSNNPYKDYTIVQVLYCSGDVHGGDTTRDYTDRNGGPVVQKGIANYQSALDWVVAQQESGALASTLSSLVVSGCSAGSIGAQLWSNEVLNGDLKYDKSAVMPDSYAGVFPDGSMGPLIKGFGTCDWLKESSEDLYTLCDQGVLTLQEIVMTYLGMLPNSAWAPIQSKADSVQESFYIAVGLTTNTSAKITSEQFYADVNEIFEQYNQYDTFVNYMVTSRQHCYSPYSIWTTADTTGTDGEGAGGQELMSDWAGLLPLDSGDDIATQCDGDELAEEDWTGWEYCDSALAGKTYTQD